MVRSVQPARGLAAPGWRVGGAVLLLTVTGCGAQDPDNRPSLAEQVEAARVNGTVALPAVEPPGLREAWVTVAQGRPVVSFHSENGVVVTLLRWRPR